MHLSFFLQAQMQPYHYQRDIGGVQNTWHTITLPPEIYEHTQNSLADIRIFGLTRDNDTVEVPYVLNPIRLFDQTKAISHRIINISERGNQYYYTFEIHEPQAINHITLDFAEQNFDWSVKLEGSHTQSEWYTVLEDYRIMSIRNPYTDFKYTSLHFPNAKYKYFRLSIPAKEQPNLKNSSIARKDSNNVLDEIYNAVDFKINENKPEKTSEIFIELSHYVPVHSIEILSNQSQDYYRPISVFATTNKASHASDERQNYVPIGSGMLTSFDSQKIEFEPFYTRQIKVVVHNQDNLPLKIDHVKITGPKRILTARFPAAEKYFMLYGNTNVYAPQYELAHFPERIPQQVTQITLGEEKSLQVAEVSKSFIQKSWLWVLMGLIIVLLVWFSLSILQKSKT